MGEKRKRTAYSWGTRERKGGGGENGQDAGGSRILEGGLRGGG